MCVSKLEYMYDTSINTTLLKSVLVVSNFMDVSLSHLLGVSLDRDTNFSIYL